MALHVLIDSIGLKVHDAGELKSIKAALGGFC
jgi:hypothetical protein